MAATVAKSFRLFYRQILRNIPDKSHKSQLSFSRIICAGSGIVIGSGLTLLLLSSKPKRLVFAEAKEPGSSAAVISLQQTQRELRFLTFASVEYENQVFMTPLDFLESVTEESPRARSGRRKLTKADVDKALRNTKPHWKGSSHLFRDLGEDGLISYTEYLFLICVLTKPKSGFRIAFNMFDTDGNQRVDKREFLVMEQLFSGSPNVKQDGTDTPLDTTLMVHFFGRSGHEVLRYQDFHRFMDQLQSEVLELEFNEFSRGLPLITEEEFARILLRYTVLSEDETLVYMERLRERLPDTKGISFEQFKKFGQFLNGLDDFALAMRIYTYADQPISEDDFKRAVKACMGFDLDSHLIHAVFQLFDSDGDGHLSHLEFISVMKDRLHRGFKSQAVTNSHWIDFKNCVRTEIRNS